MTTLTFTTPRAWAAMLSMATTLHENALSDPDEDPYEPGLAALVEALTDGVTPGPDGSAVLTLPDNLYPLAQRVHENCLDNASTDNGEDDLRADEVVLNDLPRDERACCTKDALLAALRLLETADNMPAYWRIHDMLAQRGCEHFDSAGDGSLTDLVDIIIDG